MELIPSPLRAATKGRVTYGTVRLLRAYQGDALADWSFQGGHITGASAHRTHRSLRDLDWRRHTLCGA